MSAEWLAAAEDYGSCPSALPEVEEPAEPAAVPRNTRRRKVGVAALLVAVGGLAGLVASRQMMRPRAGEIKVQEESPSTPSKVLSSSDMRLLYSKHARLSLDPKAECAWLSSTLGLDAHFTNVSESTTQGTHLCAELCEAMTLNGVALSDSKSWGTNAGSMKPVSARARATTAARTLRPARTIRINTTP